MNNVRNTSTLGQDAVPHAMAEMACKQENNDIKFSVQKMAKEKKNSICIAY